MTPEEASEREELRRDAAKAIRALGASWHGSVSLPDAEQVLRQIIRAHHRLQNQKIVEASRRRPPGTRSFELLPAPEDTLRGIADRINVQSRPVPRPKPWGSEPERYGNWFPTLVRYTAVRQGVGHLQGSEEAAMGAASGVAYGDLGPIEKRAVAILRGVKGPPRGGIIEREARRIAGIILREWPAHTLHPPGKPRGAKGSAKLIKRGPLFKWKVPISATEFLEYALPILAGFVGADGERLSVSETLVEALAAVASYLGVNADVDSLRRLIYRDRQIGRA